MNYCDKHGHRWLSRELKSDKLTVNQNDLRRKSFAFITPSDEVIRFDICLNCGDLQRLFPPLVEP